MEWSLTTTLVHMRSGRFANAVSASSVPGASLTARLGSCAYGASRFLMKVVLPAHATDVGDQRSGELHLSVRQFQESREQP